MIKQKKSIREKELEGRADTKIDEYKFIVANCAVGYMVKTEFETLEQTLHKVKLDLLSNIDLDMTSEKTGIVVTIEHKYL